MSDFLLSDLLTGRSMSSDRTDLPVPDALLFDLDGVLADVSRSYRACIVETAAQFGFDISIEDIDDAKRGGNANNDWLLTQRLLAERGSVVELSDVIRIFQTIYEGTEHRPGLRNLETLLIKKDVFESLADTWPLAVVTGRPGAEANWFLHRFGLSQHIKVVIAMEDAPLKPDPQGVREAIRVLGASQAWMIGDTPDDMRAATTGGAVGIGIANAFDADMSTSLYAAGAAVVLPDVNQLKEILS